MDNFDDTTYQPERLMFWPSHSIDGEYIFDYQDSSWVDPDEVLAEYPDWSDSSCWPESSRGHNIRVNQAKRQVFQMLLEQILIFSLKSLKYVTKQWSIHI